MSTGRMGSIFGQPAGGWGGGLPSFGGGGLSGGGGGWQPGGGGADMQDSGHKTGHSGSARR